MRRKVYGYGSYRGRGRGNTALKIVAAILVIVLILAVAAFLLAERYMVYDDSGQARLELPFLQKDEEEPEESPVISSPAPSVVISQPPPEKPEKPETILPVSLSLEALYNGTAAEAVTEAGGTAALFDMKPESGVLGWVSDQALAIAAKVSQDDPARNEQIQTAAEEDTVYRIARLSCFKDHELSNADISLAMYTASGYRWLDADSNRWVSPANETVQDYLIALCKELAELGFDEILLDHAGYPTRGQLGYIKKDAAYNAEEFDTVITGFYEKVAEALKDTGVALSVVYDPETVALSGQSEEEIKNLGISIVVYDENGKLNWQK